MATLPHDIVVIILSKLPLKPLLKCATVCKSWRDTILTKLHDTEFVEMQVIRATQVDLPCLVLYSRNFSKGYLYLFDFNHEHQDNQCNHFNMVSTALVNTPLNCLGLNFNKVISCNGLLLLYQSSKYGPEYVCNPITNEYIALPEPIWQLDWRYRVAASGFGFDFRNKEYKVLKIMLQGWAEDPSNWKAMVWTVGKSKTWRSISDPLGDGSRRIMDEYCVNVNGALHWLIFCGHPFVSRILAWDIEDETFRYMPIPFTYAPQDAHHEVKLCESWGCLCIFHSTPDGGVDIWIMEEYNNEGSWTKQVNDLRNIQGKGVLTFGVERTKRVIRARASYFAEERVFDNIEVEDPRAFNEVHAVTHIGSYVAIEGGTVAV